MKWNVFETRQTGRKTKQFLLHKDLVKKYIPVHGGVQDLNKNQDILKL